MPNPAGDYTCAGPFGVDLKKKPTTKVFSSYMHNVDANYLQAPQEKDIPAANIVLNEKILALRTQWECNVTTCHSEHCFIPTEGPHFTLSHTHFEKWGAAIVRSLDLSIVLISIASIYTLSSYMVTTL